MAEEIEDQNDIENYIRIGNRLEELFNNILNYTIRYIKKIEKEVVIENNYETSYVYNGMFNFDYKMCAYRGITFLGEFIICLDYGYDDSNKVGTIIFSKKDFIEMYNDPKLINIILARIIVNDIESDYKEYAKL